MRKMITCDMKERFLTGGRKKKALNKFNVLLHSVNMIHGVEEEISHYLVFSQMQKQNDEN